MLILLSLLQPALACDPAPWGVEGVWPAQTDAMPPSAAPLLQIADAGGTSFVLVDAEDADIVGSSRVLATNGFGAFLRFTPDEALVPGDYELSAIAPFEQGEEIVRFTVVEDAPSIPAVAPVNLELTWQSYDENGDSCDDRARHNMTLDWEWPDVFQARNLALSVHLVDPADKTTVIETLGMYQGPDVMTQVERNLRVPILDGGAFADPVCVSIAVWGDRDASDAVSEVVCYNPTTDPGPGPGGEEGVDSGCACSSQATPLSMLPLAGLLGLLWVRRRRD